jgi:phosphoribosylanthranilate isomerase
MSLWVKLCGMGSISDVEAAIESGADAVGIVLSASPRQVDFAQAAEMAGVAAGNITTVAVFYFPTVDEVMTAHEEVGFDMYQAETVSLPRISGVATLPVVHDSENLEFDVQAARSYSVSGLVLVEGRGKGGHGEPANKERFAQLSPTGDLMLAGGLNPVNVGAVVREFELAGVDVSSGIESAPGVKDHGLMRDFVAAVREAEKE